MTERMKRPAYQWYPGDFRRDTAVAACTFEARALWREMLDLMHDGEPYGHLTAGGAPIDVPQLARIVGVSAARVCAWMTELEDRKVFSRTAAGIIYSRRMTRDERNRNARGSGGSKSLENPNVPRPKHPQQALEGILSPHPSEGPSGGPSGGPLQLQLQSAAAAAEDPAVSQAAAEITPPRTPARAAPAPAAPPERAREGPPPLPPELRALPDAAVRLLERCYAYVRGDALTIEQRDKAEQLRDTLTPDGAHLERGKEPVRAVDAAHLAAACVATMRGRLKNPKAAVRVVLLKLQTSYATVATKRASHDQALEQAEGDQEYRRAEAWLAKSPQAKRELAQKLAAIDVPAGGLTSALHETLRRAAVLELYHAKRGHLAAVG